MSEALLALQDTEVWRGKRMIAAGSGVSLAEGEMLALIGPNGAGKSTLLGVSSLLFEPSRGHVLYRGEPVPSSRGPRLAMRRRFGSVFQEPLLLDRTARQNVALPLELRKVPRKEAAARADEWLERLNIPHLREQNGRTLSGGEAQRVSLARTLIAGPEIVFLDEPLAALDSPTRERMMQELPVLLEGKAAMLVTHDHGEARRLAQRVAVMLDGKVVQQGAVEDVFLRPASLELAKFLGVENLVPARREGELVVFPSGLEWRCDEKSQASGDVVVCLRAESVTVGPAQAHQDDVCLRGRITAAQPRAVGLAVWVSLPGFTLEARAWPGGSQRMCLELGAEIDVHFHRQLVHLVSLQPQ